MSPTGRLRVICGLLDWDQDRVIKTNKHELGTLRRAAGRQGGFRSGGGGRGGTVLYEANPVCKWGLGSYLWAPPQGCEVALRGSFLPLYPCTPEGI